MGAVAALIVRWRRNDPILADTKRRAMAARQSTPSPRPERLIWKASHRSGCPLQRPPIPQSALINFLRDNLSALLAPAIMASRPFNLKFKLCSCPGSARSLLISGRQPLHELCLDHGFIALNDYPRLV